MGSLRDPHFIVGTGIGSLDLLREELDDARDLLLGRLEPPFDNGVLTMMEVADALYCRGKEIEQLILRAEAEGKILKNTEPYRFRTGELRSFLDLARSCVELGSRRVTTARLEWEMKEA